MPTLAVFIAANLLSAKLHYVMIFATQDTPAGVRPSIRSVHSFANWVEVEGKEVTSEFTISWVAARGVRVWGGPQAGRNMTLEESLAEARRNGRRVSMWGPYRVSGESLERARAQFERLESAESTGRIKYKLLDHQTFRSSKSPAYHCVHALTDVTGEKIPTGAVAGLTASEMVVETYVRRGLILGAEPDVDWVWNEVRPEGYEVARRSARVPGIAAPPSTPVTGVAARPAQAPADDSLKGVSGFEPKSPQVSDTP